MMLPIILCMLLVPLAALVILALAREEFSNKIAITSTLIGLVIILASLAFSIGTGSINVSENYQYAGIVPIGLKFSITPVSLALLTMSAVILLATALSGNPENKEQKTSSAFILMFQIASVGIFASANLLLFYLFWNIGIIAMFLMINLLGSTGKRDASMNFLLHWALASALLLLGIMLLYSYIPQHSLDMQYILTATNQMPTQMQSIIFLLMLLAFIIGTPLFPMHLWLADANAEASTQCTMLLSGIMTKFSGYGMLLLFTMLSISSRYSIYVAVLASFSVLYYAFVLIRQTDIKRIASYSSAIGMGIVVLGICTLNNFGVYGAAYAMLAHGLGVALLFLVAGCMKHIFGERDIRAIGGAVLNARLTAYAFIVGILAVIGFPLTAGFVAEILVFVGAIHAFGSIIVIPLLGIVLAGAYLYSVANRAMFSTKEPSSVVDSIGKAQFLGYALLISFIFLFGLMPSVILNLVGL